MPIEIPFYDAESDAYTSSVVYKRGYGLSYQSNEDTGDEEGGKTDETQKITDASVEDIRTFSGKFAVIIVLSAVTLFGVITFALITFVRKNKKQYP